MSAARRQTKLNQPAMRRSVGRPALARDSIVANALAILEEQGASGLSMRTLAERMGSGTATLYRHFANRAELVAELVDHVFGEMEREDVSGLRWQDACRKLANALFKALSRRWRVAPLLLEQVPLGPNALAQRERFLAVLLDGGFPAELAAHTYATVARYVLGFAIQHDAASAGAKAATAAKFRALSQASFPATAKVAAFLPVPLEQEFAFGLKLIVDGLGEPRSSAGAQRKRPPQRSRRSLVTK